MGLYVSAVALIDADGRILLASRPDGRDYAGCWEFPGGKIEGNETPEAALVRELDEELGIQTEQSCLAPFSFGTAIASPKGTNEAAPDTLVMLVFVCRKWTGRPTPKEGQRLKWVRPQALLEWDMPPVDRPIAAQLRDYLSA